MGRLQGQQTIADGVLFCTHLCCAFATCSVLWPATVGLDQPRLTAQLGQSQMKRIKVFYQNSSSALGGIHGSYTRPTYPRPDFPIPPCAPVPARPLAPLLDPLAPLAALQLPGSDPTSNFCRGSGGGWFGRCQTVGASGAEWGVG